MPSRTIDLTDDQAEMIDRLVRSGRYRSADHVLRESLRLLEQQEAEDAAKLAALREAIQVGIDDMEAGRYRTFGTAEEIREHVANLTRRGRRRDGAGR